MADNVYRSFLGYVKFEPKEAEAGGKQVRQIVLRNVGVKDQAMDVRATLWPSHADFAVEQGDAVLVEGKFTVNKTEEKTYFNLSVSRILNFGPGDPGEREATTNGGSNDAEDDDESY